jgi:hypothetical protein
LKRFKTRRSVRFPFFKAAKEKGENFLSNFFAAPANALLLLKNGLRFGRSAAKQRKNDVFPFWRRVCLIAGVPLMNAAHWVARGYLARSFAKSF